MQIYQRLLTALLLVTSIPLLIYFSVGIVVQNDALNNFQEVGGELLPANIASARTITSLYHILYMTDKYANNRDKADKKKVEILIANLDVHVAMSMLYHNFTSNKLEADTIIQFAHAFSRFISKYLLLIEKGAPKEELNQAKIRIDRSLESFISVINPFIDKELNESSEKLKASKQKSTKVFYFLATLGLLTICLSLAISLYISRRFRAVDKENENFKHNLESLVTERTHQLHGKNAELENEISERRKIEEELRNSERTLESVLDSAIPICITDINFEVLRTNKSYLQIWPHPETKDNQLKCQSALKNDPLSASKIDPP